MSVAIKIECGFTGCDQVGEMTSITSQHYNIGEHKLTQMVTQSAAPLGWGYVQIAKGVRRAFCHAHKGPAEVQEQEKRAADAMRVKKPVARPARVRRGR